jgi:hypothetical protein
LVFISITPFINDNLCLYSLSLHVNVQAIGKAARINKLGQGREKSSAPGDVLAPRRATLQNEFHCRAFIRAMEFREFSAEFDQNRLQFKMGTHYHRSNPFHAEFLPAGRKT